MKPKFFMNKLFFSLFFFLLQTHHTSLFSSQDKTDIFIRTFPRLTFPAAKKQFGKLTDDQQTRVWRKLDTNEKDKDKILPLALRMAHIEPTLQYAILSENFTILEKKKSDETIEDYNKRISVPHKIYTDSIYDLFRWKAIIDIRYRNLEINPRANLPIFMPITKGYIRISKSTLFNLTIDHLKTIPKAQERCLTKKEIQLLVELPDNILEALKPYYNYDVGRYHGYDGTTKIKFFYYKNPTITSTLMKVLDTAIFILPPLLCYCFYVRPGWNAITGTQDPVALAQNATKELHNQTIDRLQRAGTNGSEHLIRQLIKPVPFKTSWSDWLKMSKQIIPMGSINGFLIGHTLFNTESRDTSSSKGNKPDKSARISYTTRSLFDFIKNKNNMKFDAILAIFALYFVVGSFTALFTTNFLYDSDFFADLFTLPEVIIGCIEISAAIALLINTIQNLKPTPYWKPIDFSKEKFKNKSVKECINYYLHHPTIIMKKK